VCFRQGNGQVNGTRIATKGGDAGQVSGISPIERWNQYGTPYPPVREVHGSEHGQLSRGINNKGLRYDIFARPDIHCGPPSSRSG
jgi:hypothetical protein